MSHLTQARKTYLVYSAILGFFWLVGVWGFVGFCLAGFAFSPGCFHNAFLAWLELVWFWLGGGVGS